MEDNSSESGHDDIYSLSRERARLLIERQEAICRMLGEQAITKASDIIQPLIEDVRQHVITCDRGHPRISGLFLD